MKVKGYAVEKIPFAKYAYHQEWMNDSNSIYTAKNSKVNLGEPSVFVVYPEIEADDFKTLDDLKQIPEEAALWREFFKHPNGAKRVTKIAITSTNLNKESETTRALNEIENLTVKQGQQHLMELYFDNQAQDKTFDLRPDLPLKIYL